jgi:hypothetical protein
MHQNLLYLPNPSSCVERNSCSAAWELQIAFRKLLEVSVHSPGGFKNRVLLHTALHLLFIAVVQL